MYIHCIGMEQTTRIERSENVRMIEMLDMGLGIFTVRGSTGNTYTVDVNRGTCTCPDYVYRMGPQGGKCKHMIRVLKVIEEVA